MWHRSAGEWGAEGRGDEDMTPAEGVLGAGTPWVGAMAAAGTGEQWWQRRCSGNEGGVVAMRAAVLKKCLVSHATTLKREKETTPAYIRWLINEYMRVRNNRPTTDEYMPHHRRIYGAGAGQP
jgi:hypothetical protein